MHGVPAALRGMAQGRDQYVQSARLERRYFLRDEGLGEARVALEDEGNAAG